MLKSERHTIIVDLIRQQQNVQMKELKELFEVSDETIRRDLLELEQQGLLRCVHGGAVYDSPTTQEYHIGLRIKKNQLEKEEICKKAAELIEDGQSISIAGSTSTISLGTHLALKNNLTVITNSIYLANQIMENKTNTVHLVGGTLWVKDQKTMGREAEREFGRFQVDKAFFSVAGVSPEKGLMEYNEDETELTKAVLCSAREPVLMNDSTKFDLLALYRIADIGSIQDLVTDWHISASELLPYRDAGIKIHRVTQH